MIIDEGMQPDLWKLTFGILNLSNVSFKRSGDGFAEIDPKTAKFVTAVTDLWGVKSNCKICDNSC